MNKNLSFFLLIFFGMGLGIGIAELGGTIKEAKMQKDAISAQISQLDSQIAQNEQISESSEQDFQNLDSEISAPDSADSQNTQIAQTTLTIKPQAIYTNNDASQNALHQWETFARENELPTFEAYSTQIFQGQKIKADDTCINCVSPMQDAIRRGEIEFAGQYALFVEPLDDGFLELCAVNLQNGAKITLPQSFLDSKEPFELVIYARPDSNLLWVRGIDKNNKYGGAWVLENGAFSQIYEF